MINYKVGKQIIRKTDGRTFEIMRVDYTWAIIKRSDTNKALKLDILTINKYFKEISLNFRIGDFVRTAKTRFDPPSNAIVWKTSSQNKLVFMDRNGHFFQVDTNLIFSVEPIYREV